jgi:hypothetical protein
VVLGAAPVGHQVRRLLKVLLKLQPFSPLFSRLALQWVHHSTDVQNDQKVFVCDEAPLPVSGF